MPVGLTEAENLFKTNFVPIFSAKQEPEKTQVSECEIQKSNLGISIKVLKIIVFYFLYKNMFIFTINLKYTKIIT